MKPADVAALVKGVLPPLRDYVEAQIASLEAEFARATVAANEAATKAIAEAIAALPPPVVAKSLTLDDVRPMLAEMVAALPPAPQGEPGESVDPVTVKAMIDEAVAALPPAEKGEPGAPAEPIHPDTVRVMVAEEVSKAVSAIPQPQAGEPGRDALQLEILPAIDSAKGYARGTWAKHDGGIVRAYRNTDPIVGELDRAGWEVVVDGVKSTAIERTDVRAFRFVIERTSGAKSALDCAFPVLIDRGRHSEEKEYETGDVVDWSGSMWIAQAPSKGVEPRAGADEWRLAVRRGRDGKDAIVRTVEAQRVKV